MIKLPLGVDIKNLIVDLRNFSWESSEILLYYAQIIKDSNNRINIISNDNVEDPVTLADLKVNEKIIQRINEKYQNICWEILSEENAKISEQKFNYDSKWVWILDPLDGTRDFIQGTNNYAMHLALNHQKKPLIGIVLIPERNELWIANGKDVWCETRDGSRKKFQMTRNKTLREMTLITSKNHRNKTLNKLIQKVNFKSVLVMGSIGCKIAAIVRGECDIYITLSLPGQSCPKDWDFAAPSAILKAAGGAITNINNEELSYGKLNFDQGGIIVASNNINSHKRVCLEIKEIIKKYDLYPL